MCHVSDTKLGYFFFFFFLIFKLGYFDLFWVGGMGKIFLFKFHVFISLSCKTKTMHHFVPVKNRAI